MVAKNQSKTKQPNGHDDNHMSSNQEHENDEDNDEDISCSMDIDDDNEDDDDNDDDSSRSHSSFGSSATDDSGQHDDNDEESAKQWSRPQTAESSPSSFSPSKVVGNIDPPPQKEQQHAIPKQTTTATKTTTCVSEVLTSNQFHNRRRRKGGLSTSKSEVARSREWNNDKNTTNNNNHNNVADHVPTSLTDDDDSGYRKGKRNKGKRKKQPKQQQGVLCNSLDRLALWLDRHCPLLLLHRVCHALFWICFVGWMLVVVVELQQRRQEKHSVSAGGGGGEGGLPPVKQSTFFHDRLIQQHQLSPRQKQQLLLDEQLKNDLKAQGVVHFMSDVAEGLWDVTSSSNKNKNITQMMIKRKKRKEEEIPGCVRDAWQSLNFPTCNDLHEIDVLAIFQQSQEQRKEPYKLAKRQRYRYRFVRNEFAPLVGQPAQATNQTRELLQQQQPNISMLLSNHNYNNATGYLQSPFHQESAMEANNEEESMSEDGTMGEKRLGYLGSGYWKSAWAINPRMVDELVVLKAMKREHDVDLRNLERHRRDALVMERLTFSPNIVDIFGYCGNAVISELLSTSLEDVIDGDEDNNDYYDAEKSSKDIEQASQERANNPKYLAGVTRDTEEGRLHLFLQVIQGLYSIHFTFPTGPIVHADITSAQFLVNSLGIVKMNDFNRCRFMAHKASNSSELCPFIIPTAPGKARSPEEYAEEKLTQQLDVYSTANILYRILTGHEPWSGLTVTELKRTVKAGGQPKIPSYFRRPNSTDELLAQIVERAYAVDPKVRPTAERLLQDLQQIAIARYGNDSKLMGQEMK
ncbi:hypothetical protein ACA910_012667 [Epithemia clementina (nom. ined.)]